MRAAANRDSQSNGALMRASPIGIWGTFHDAAKVADIARQDAQLTHPHQVCQDASAVFVATLAATIREGLSPVQAYDFGVQRGATSTVMDALTSARTSPPTDYLSQQGWVLIALQNAFYQLLHAPSLEQALVTTVRAGGDTDTNAAICGALLGAVHGRASIPDQWQQMVLSCRPLIGQPGIRQPRPAVFWPNDALVLAERLLTA
jgi:ADP-ribosylglycohydrolase